MSDPQIKQALQKLAEFVGESKPPYRAVNADDIRAEYQTKYSTYGTKERGAFKAKLTRLLNSAKETGDEATQRALAGVQMTLMETEKRELKDSILHLATLIPSVEEEE